MTNNNLAQDSKDNITPEYKGWILKAINYHFPNAKVILFGSRARGTNSPASDVDIDIVDMHNIPEELKQIILKEGIVWQS